MKDRAQETQVLSSVPPMDSLPDGRLWHQTLRRQTIFVRDVAYMCMLSYLATICNALPSTIEISGQDTHLIS